MENFLEALESLSKQPPYLLQVAEKIKSHNLPVIIFGAAQYAQVVANKLISAGVKISGFAVDKEYYKPNQRFLGYPTFQYDMDEKFYSPAPEFVGLPIYNFEELCKTPDKYVFVLGVGRKSGADRQLEFMSDKKNIKYVLEQFDKCYTLDYEYILNNKEKFFATYNLLTDDLSKKTFAAYIKAQLTESLLSMENVLCGDEYFNELTCRITGGRGCYIDCGAYDGDTVEQFINFTDGNYKKIFAIDADPENFAQMENLIREKNYKNVELINCGVWNEKGSITFQSSNDTMSKIGEGGDIIVPTDTIDDIVGDENISFIKMDIEGAELNALKGAIKTLERCKPILALSAYHKKEDLITLPQFIKNIYGDCKFYLRKHGNSTALYDFVLYVIPN